MLRLLVAATAVAVAAGVPCTEAPAGHTSCAALQQACADQNAGGLIAADTASASTGGTYECEKCDGGTVPAVPSTAASEDTAWYYNLGENFNMLQGSGLHYSLAVLGTTLLLFVLSWWVRRGNLQREQAKRDRAFEEGAALSAEPSKWREAYAPDSWLGWGRLTVLGWTGAVSEDDGSLSSFCSMLRNVQPWELMYCNTCGVKFVCGDEKTKYHFLRWARLYFGLCLSFGLSVMFSAITYDALFHSPSCHMTKEPETTLDAIVGYLPIDKFTSTYATVIVLVKVADIAVGRLTEAVTRRGFCASFAARVLLLGLGAAFVGLAVLFQWDADIDLSAGVKALAYFKMVLIERFANWCGVTPMLLLWGYATGRCLHKSGSADKAAELTGGGSGDDLGGAPLVSRPVSMTSV